MTTSLKKNSLSQATVIDDHEVFLTSIITVDIDAPHTAQEEALRVVYGHMLQSGCDGYTRDAFMHAMNLLGMHLSVQADDSRIMMQFQARTEVLGKALTLFKAMLTSPTWSSAELKRVKEFIVNQLELSKEDARTRAHEQFVNEFVHELDWRYSFDTDACISAIKLVQTKQLKQFHEKIFEHHWNITSGGPSSSCAKVAQVLKTLHLKDTKVPTTHTHKVLLHDASIVTLIDIPHKQNIEFSIGGALPLTTASPKFPAFVLGMSILAISGCFSGRLMSTVREKEGLTYMVYGRIEGITPHEEGFWRIFTFFSPNDAKKGIASVLHQINLMRTKGITDDELRRFKEILHTRDILVHDSLIRTVHEMHERRVMGISEEEHHALLQKIQHLTVPEVNEAMKEYLSTDALVMSGAGPVSRIEHDLKTKFSGNHNV